MLGSKDIWCDINNMTHGVSMGLKISDLHLVQREAASGDKR